MAKLLREEPANKYSGLNQYWLVGNRFEILLVIGNEKCSFFIEDNLKLTHPLKLIPKIINDLDLNEDPRIKIIPSIDTCSISVPKSQFKEILALIEKYLITVKQ